MQHYDVELGASLQGERQVDARPSGMLALEIETLTEAAPAPRVEEEEEEDEEKEETRKEKMKRWACWLGMAIFFFYFLYQDYRQILRPYVIYWEDQRYWRKAMDADSEWQQHWHKVMDEDSNLQQNWQKFPAVYSATGRVTAGLVADMTAEEVRAELRDPSSPLLLLIHAEWCFPCWLFGPAFEFAAKMLGSRARLIKMNGGDDKIVEATQLTESLGVYSFPTVVFYAHGVRQQNDDDDLRDITNLLKVVAEANR